MRATTTPPPPPIRPLSPTYSPGTRCVLRTPSDPDEAATRLQWETGALRDGLRRYAAGQYFAAHEAWEGVWLQAHEPHKTLLQALIQVAAAQHHLQRRNVRGAMTLLRAANLRLARFPERFGGICIGMLREQIAERLCSTEAGRASDAALPIDIRIH